MAFIDNTTDWGTEGPPKGELRDEVEFQPYTVAEFVFLTVSVVNDSHERYLRAMEVVHAKP
jgi:hypothetical protein